jgi:hypothetical protein
MTKHEGPKHEGMTNDECLMTIRTLDCLASSFVLRHSFVLGYFVLRHSFPLHVIVRMQLPAFAAHIAQGRIENVQIVGESAGLVVMPLVITL